MSLFTRYSIAVIRDEVRQLVQQGMIRRNQSIHALCQYIPEQEWKSVELELEANDFLLRDRIADLIPNERWDNDG